MNRRQVVVMQPQANLAIERNKHLFVPYECGAYAYMYQGVC